MQREQIPSNTDHQEGQHRADAGTTPSWACRVLEGVPDDEQAKIVGLNTARVYNFDLARLSATA